MFGMPAPYVFDAVEARRLKLGGCMIYGEEDTTWWCSTCEDTFQGPDTSRAIDEAISLKVMDSPIETS